MSNSYHTRWHSFRFSLFKPTFFLKFTSFRLSGRRYNVLMQLYLDADKMEQVFFVSFPWLHGGHTAHCCNFSQDIVGKDGCTWALWGLSLTESCPSRIRKPLLSCLISVTENLENFGHLSTYTDLSEPRPSARGNQNQHNGGSLMSSFNPIDPRWVGHGSHLTDGESELQSV